MSALALRWMIGGECRAHPARVLLGMAAIAIGVALGFAVHLVNASALGAFDRALHTVAGDADLRVEAAGPTGFDERLYPRLARLPGIAAASPVVTIEARIGAARVPLLGLDVLRAGAVTPALIGRPATGGADALFADDALFLSRAVGGRAGAALDVVGNGRAVPMRAAGILPGVADDQPLAVADIAAVQWRFGRLGRLDRIDLKYAPGADPGRVRAAVAAALPADAAIADAGTDAASSDSLSRAYRVNLDMLALVALLTGAFLVYSAQSLSVARRAPQFALLRVLGAARAMLVGQLVIEGLAVGIVGAAAGLALGYGLAAGALALLGGDLGGGYFEGTRTGVVFAPGAALTFLALGLLAAQAGSVVPAAAVARARPAVALKDAGEAIDPARRPLLQPALLLGLAGGIAALLPAVGGLPLFGYLAIGLLLAAGIAAMPWLGRTLLAPFAARDYRAPALALALRRLWGAPSQATVALSGIVASTSLMIAMAVMVASFRGSVDEWLGEVLAADVYLRVEGGGIDPATQARVAAVPGVARAGFNRLLPLRLAADRPAVVLIARPDPERLPLLGLGAAVPAGATPVWVSEPASRLYRLRVGDTVALPLAGRHRFIVAGIWRDYARQHGAIAMREADYARITGDGTREEAAITLAPHAPAAATMAAIRRTLPPAVAAQATVMEPRQLRLTALRLFDRSFAVTYLLEAIAIAVGLAGVAATFSAQTIARAREFGMLRHVGVTRGQVLAMLGSEGALTGAVGVAAGIGLGTGMSQVLIRVVNPQSFGWTMTTRLPLGLFAGVAAALVAAAAGTAMLAGRRALSLDAVRATREDM